MAVHYTQERITHGKIPYLKSENLPNNKKIGLSSNAMNYSKDFYLNDLPYLFFSNY